MKTFVSTLAIAAIAAPAIALAAEDSDLIRTRDITGGTVYSLTEEHDSSAWGSVNHYEIVDTEWNDIGEIEDIVLSEDGKMVGVVAEIGGLLDVGDKHVMLPVEDVKLVSVDDTSYAIVTRYSEEVLEEMDGLDEAGWN